MRASRRLSVVVLCRWTWAALAACGAAAAYAKAPEWDTAGLDAELSAQTSMQSPGFAVLVRRDGRTLFARGYGVRDLRGRQAIDAKTNFRLASNSKQFTAMAIMLLVHDGKLHYESTLRDVFAEFPDYGRRITMRELLNHTSGLADYETLMDEIEEKKAAGSAPRWSAQRQIQDAEVLALLERQTSTRFEPGTRWEYSNSGYVLLGLVVAKISGQRFADFLHDRIFAPLGMNHTVAYEKGRRPIAERAYGHSRNGDAWTQTDQSSTSATLGDGGIYSNLDDLALWDEALAQHRLLAAADMQAALTAPRGADAASISLPDDAPPSLRQTDIAYGFGWFVDAYRGHPRMWHYGDTMGFKSSVQRLPDDRISVIVLANRTDQDPTAMALRVVDWLLRGTH